jgi:hypothetical protein
MAGSTFFWDKARSLCLARLTTYNAVSPKQYMQKRRYNGRRL